MSLFSVQTLLQRLEDKQPIQASAIRNLAVIIVSDMQISVEEQVMLLHKLAKITVKELK